MRIQSLRFLGISFVIYGYAALPLATQAQHRIIDTSGQVILQREGSPTRAGKRGSIVDRSDRLLVGTGALAIVRCSNNTFWKVLPGTPYPVSYGCKDTRLALRVGKQSDNARGGDNNQIPYVIQPRRTSVASDNIRLRWNPAPGASRYSVRLLRQSDGAVLWQQQVSGTSTTYPGSPALRPAEDYLVVVEANNGTSSQFDKGARKSGFKRITPEQRKQLDGQLQVLSRQNLSLEGNLLAKADIFVREELLSDAIETLESLAAKNAKIVSVYLSLGDIYRNVGLNSMAERRYQEAITLATANQDAEGLAMAQAGLAEVMEMLGQRSQAIPLFRQAQTGFQAIGNKARVDELGERINNLGTQ